MVFASMASLIYFFLIPVDIRNDYLKKELKASDYKKGERLIQEMEMAYGGKEKWLNYRKGSFIQVADWYGRKKVSGWDTLPQRYEMTTFLGTGNCQLTLLNGPNKGVVWGIEKQKTFRVNSNGEKYYLENAKQADKLIFKDYWFQLPFRIGEASILIYGGKETVNNEIYDVVYATWGSEKANSDYDQFLLYLDQESRLIEYLYFTVRDKMKGARLTTRFDNFKSVDQMILAHDQYVQYGRPQASGIKLHENHYELIQLGE